METARYGTEFSCKNDVPMNKRFRSAYSKTFDCFVKIVYIYKDAGGKLIFVGNNLEKGLNGMLFREEELSRCTF